MINRQQFLYGIILLISCAPLSQAGQWEQTTVEIQAKPVDAFVQGVFCYKQSGAEIERLPKFGPLPDGVKILPTPVTETPIDKTNITKKDPIHLFRFQIPTGCLSGEHTITLPLLDTRATEPKELKVIVKVPELVKIKPRHLIWEKGGSADAKTTSIISVTREGVILTKVVCEDDAFTAALERQAAQLYTIKITPKDINKPHLTLIRIMGTDIYGKETGFNLYAEIR